MVTSSTTLTPEQQPEPSSAQAIPMQTPIIHISNVQPAPAPEAKSFEEILAELTDPQTLERHVALIAAYDVAVSKLVTQADVQVEGKRTFKKKSAWRKLAQFFRVSTEILRNERWWEIDEESGEKHLVARVVVRGRAPWGQTAETVGLCSTRESRFYATGIRCLNCGGPMWDNRAPGKSRNGEAFRCKDNECGGSIMPGEFDESQLQRRPNATARAKADHDVEATAATRAVNRAISDLIAAGEVSAEEMEGAEEHTPLPMLQRQAFGKDWKGKTWQQVLDAGPDGESFIDWVIRNAERVSVEDKTILRRALDAKRAERTGGEPSGGQEHVEGQEGATTAGSQGATHPSGRKERHQKALVWISTNGGLLPDEVAYGGDRVQTDDLKLWIRSNWRALHEATPDVEATAVEAANGAAAALRLRKIAYQGSPPAAQPAAPPPAGGAKKTPGDNVISVAQSKRLFAIAYNEGGYTEAGLRVMVKSYGHTFDDITKGEKYNAIIEEARDPEKGEWFNEKAAEESEGAE